MSLKTTIDNDIKTAMKAKDQASLRALRAIKSAILLAETAEGRSGKELAEAEEMQLLTKQAKQRKDAYEQFSANNRDDLAQIEAEELIVIERYLPQALGPEALESAIREIIAETGAASIKDIGKGMGVATNRFAGKADNKAVSAIVKQLLG